MTRKDYVLIARAIRYAKPADIQDRKDPRLNRFVQDAWSSVRDNIARALATDNPRFDRARFCDACERED